MDYVEKELRRLYAVEQAKHAVALYQARQTRMDNAIHRYFNSTPVRNTFARLMFIAANVKSNYTKKKIAKELYISWQAAHIMVEECLEAEWIERSEHGLVATEDLVRAQYRYVEYHIQNLEGLGATDALVSLRTYRAAKSKAGLDCNDNETATDYVQEADNGR
jgi:hypothetical protein